MKALLILIFATLLAGCSKETDLAEENAQRGERTTATAAAIDPSVRTNRTTREKFFHAVYVPAYESVGSKNPKWDEKVRSLFATCAESAARGSDTEEQYAELSRKLKEVEETGCDDPLFRYIHLKNSEDPRHAHEAGTNVWVEAAVAMDASGYHQYWKFFACARAAQALKSTSPKTNSPAVVKFRGDTSMRLIELVKDYSLPTEVMYEAVNSWVLGDLSAVPKLRAWTYENLEHAMLEGWGDTAEAQLIRGAFNIKHAWDARGSGWANTVTDDGWKLMRERLQIARECLERAWVIKPMEQIALGMLTVELGDSNGRKEMERWFQNAVKLNPASYAACQNKLTWLHPKWHGSPEDVIEFGRECLTNRVGRIPLMLYQCHLQLASDRQRTGRGNEGDYWKETGVWKDVKASFEAFFELNPDAVGWRHDYALAAYKAEQWDDLRKQIKLMGPINYAFFGGKEAYEEMVRKAEQYGKEPVSL